MIYVPSGKGVRILRPPADNIERTKIIERMSLSRKFIVYGPADTLQRMSLVMADTSKPVHVYKYSTSDNEESVHVLIYADKPKMHQPNMSVTVIMEYSARSLKIDVVATGGRVAFRSALVEEIPLNEAVTDHILDYTKRLGMTIQEVFETADVEIDS